MQSILTRASYRSVDDRAFGALRRGMVTVFSGQSVAYAITFASLPALAVLYTPSDIAALGIFTGIVTIVGAASCLCYERIVPIVRSDAQAANGVALCLASVVAITLASGCCAELTLRVVGDSHVDTWGQGLAALLAVAILATGVQQALQAMSVRRQDFHALSIARVSMVVARVALQIGLGLLWAGPAGLLWGFTIASVVSAAVACWLCRRDLPLVSRIRFRVVRRIALRFIEFPAFAVIPEVVQRLTLHLPAILLAIFYNLDVAGWYTLALRAFAAPQTILHQAISRVYFGVGASTSARQPERLAALFRFALGRMALFVTPIYVAAMFAAQPIFAITFGDEWQPAGVYCTILAPMFLLQLIVGALRPTIDLLMLPRLHAITASVIAVGLFVGIGVPSLLALPAWAAIAGLGVGVGASQLAALWIMWRALPAAQADHLESLPLAA